MLKITTFTDPMMGLSYESEPFFRKLETHFAGHIEFHTVMAGLVRNVYDFVNPADLAISEAVAIERYLPHLAAIYNAEQSISGMPISMENLDLFSTDRTSSIPLNLAYKTVQQLAPEKADEFLYRLRFATIVEVRPTTKLNELARVAGQVGIDEQTFLNAYHLDDVKASLTEDFQRFQQLGIRGLPAYLLEYQGKRVVVNGVLDDRQFFILIAQLTQNNLLPQKPEISQSAVKNLIEKHKLISSIEIQYAFGLANVNNIMPYLNPLLMNGEIKRIEVQDRGKLSSLNYSFFSLYEPYRIL